MALVWCSTVIATIRTPISRNFSEIQTYQLSCTERETRTFQCFLTPNVTARPRRRSEQQRLHSRAKVMASSGDLMKCLLVLLRTSLPEHGAIFHSDAGRWIRCTWLGPVNKPASDTRGSAVPGRGSQFWKLFFYFLYFKCIGWICVQLTTWLQSWTKSK